MAACLAALVPLLAALVGVALGSGGRLRGRGLGLGTAVVGALPLILDHLPGLAGGMWLAHRSPTAMALHCAWALPHTLTEGSFM